MSAGAFAAVSAGLNILGAIGHNKAVKKARDRALAQEEVRTSIELGNNARRTRQISGARKVSFGERNVFGRSSQARLLSDIGDGLRNEESLLIQEFFNKADIKSQASRSMKSPLSEGISGAISGFQFGMQVDSWRAGKADPGGG